MIISHRLFHRGFSNSLVLNRVILIGQRNIRVRALFSCKPFFALHMIMILLTRCGMESQFFLEWARKSHSLRGVTNKLSPFSNLQFF